MLMTEVPSSGDIRILAAGLTRHSAASLQVAPNGSYSLRELALNSDAVLVFDARVANDIEQSLPALWEEIPAGETAFIALVPRRPSPQIDASYGEPTSSFLCSSAVFERFVELGIFCRGKTLCFAVLRTIVEGSLDVDRLLVRQVPLPARLEYAATSGSKALVMPHRGDPAFLRAALKYIGKTKDAELKVRVGLDVEDCAPYETFPDEFPDVEFFDFSPSPLGPYVIRQELAERSSETLLTLQDSDDLSSYDRFAVLGAALTETGCDIVGSHELCIDEIRSLVQPVRFPLDCTAALNLCPNHALLHGTMMTRRRVFFNAGGLSTHLPIANDTQFLLRAHFSSTIRNVDEFLYIRRRHATSLTNAPETVYDNPLRRRLSKEWTGDFRAIVRGELKLEDSSLRPVRRAEPFTIARFLPGPKPLSATA